MRIEMEVIEKSGKWEIMELPQNKKQWDVNECLLSNTSYTDP